MNHRRQRIGLATTLLFLAFALSCSTGDFFLPSDTLQEDPVPERFVKPLDDGWTWLGIAPEDRSGMRVGYLDYRRFPEFEEVSRPGPTAGVISADARHLWVVPRTRFPSLTNGLIQIDLSTMTGTLMNDLNVSLPSNRVRSIRARGDGTVWIGTTGGAMNFDPETWFGTTFDDWATFDQRGGGLQRNYLLFTTTPSVYDILERRGRILFLTGDLYVFNPGRVKWSRYGRAIAPRHWNSYENRFVVKRQVYDEKRKKQRTYEVKVSVRVEENAMSREREDGLVDETVFGGAVSSDRAFLLSHHGVTEVDFKQKTWRHHVRAHSEAEREIECLKTHKKLKVCVSERWNISRRIWSETAKLLDAMPTSCAFDSGGAAWFGFQGMASGRHLEQGRSGIMRYADGRWEVIRDRLLADRRVTDLVFAGEDLYAGTTTGLLRLRGGSWKRVRIPADGHSVRVLDLEFAAGRLWVATPHGIYFKVLSPTGAEVSPEATPLPLPGSRRTR